MLKGISPLLAPELLATMCRMGHGDELILADAHFPGESFNQNIIRADGLQIPDLWTASSRFSNSISTWMHRSS